MGDDAARSVNHGDDPSSCHPRNGPHSLATVNHRIALLAAAWAATAATSSAAISIQNFTPATNDRFAHDPAFTAAAYDWSGVGRASDGRWVTMLSSNVFISATHNHPGLPGIGIGTTVSFLPGNNPGSPAISGTIASAQQIGITDLWNSHLGDSAVVPGTAPTSVTVGGVDFVSSVFDADKNNMQATIPASAAAPGTKLFGRLKAEQN